MTTPMGAVGATNDNEAYLASLLKYDQTIEAQMSGRIEASALWGLFLRSLLVWLVTLILSLPLAFVLFLNGNFEGAFLLSLWLPTLAFWASFFFPQHEGLGEWKILLDDKASAADSVFATVYGALSERQMPMAARTKRFRWAGGPQINNFLVLSDGPVHGYVAVFPYGTSLYVSWIMYRKRSPFRMLLRFLQDTFLNVGGSDDFIGQLRSQRTRAMREAMHAAVREGVDAATFDRQVPLFATFGRDLPVESLDSGSGAPLPAPLVAQQRRPSARPSQGKGWPTAHAEPGMQAPVPHPTSRPVPQPLLEQDRWSTAEPSPVPPVVEPPAGQDGGKGAPHGRAAPAPVPPTFGGGGAQQ